MHFPQLALALESAGLTKRGEKVIGMDIIERSPCVAIRNLRHVSSLRGPKV